MVSCGSPWVGHSCNRFAYLVVGSFHDVYPAPGPRTKPRYVPDGAQVYLGRLLCCGSSMSFLASSGVQSPREMASVFARLTSIEMIRRSPSSSLPPTSDEGGCIVREGSELGCRHFGFMIRRNESDAMVKINGDSGHPCLISLVALKLLYEVPLSDL